MKINRTFSTALALAAFSAGCVGYGPNTQQGAVGGAVAGALVGGVIGHNRGSGNALSGAAIGAATGGLGGAMIGNSLDHQRGTVYYPRSEYDAPYIVEQPPSPPPPPPRELVVVRPAREAIWVPGYHAYVGRGYYEWVPGHWEVPPGPYRQFEHPRWERRGRSYVYVRGYWR